MWEHAAGRWDRYIHILAIATRKQVARKLLPSTTLALSSETITVCRADPVAVLRLEISVMPRRAASDLPLTCSCLFLSRYAKFIRIMGLSELVEVLRLSR